MGMMPQPSQAQNSGGVELSIVLLCYRAGEQVIPIVKRIEALCEELTPDWQLVLVGNYHDGSDDNTPDVVRDVAANHPRVLAVVEPKLGMMGWDARSGLDVATGKYLCLIDGDGQFPTESIRACFERIRGGGVDLTMTFREHREDGWLRKILSAGYNGLFPLFFPGIGCRDVNSKPKVFTRAAYGRMALQSDDWFIDAEIMIAVRRLGLRFEQIPTVFRPLEGRSSFVHVWTVMEFLANLVRYRIREFRR